VYNTILTLFFTLLVGFFFGAIVMSIVVINRLVRLDAQLMIAYKQLRQQRKKLQYYETRAKGEQKNAN
jgi:hypothetical protein